MKLSQLEVFLEVARTGGVRSAAAGLCLSQSAVTKALAQLEADHGVRLFDRTGKGLRLTEAGEKLLPCAQSLIAGAERARRVLADYGEKRQRELRVAVAPAVPAKVVAEALEDFKGRFPETEVTFTSGLFADAAPLILTDKLDLSLLIVSDNTKGGVAKFTLENLFTIRYGIVMRKKHPLRLQPELSWLAKASWLTTNSRATTARELDQVQKIAGIARPELVTYCDNRTAEALLAASNAVALAPLNCLEEPGSALAAIPEERFSMPLLWGAFVARRDAELTAPALALKDALRRAVERWTSSHPTSALQAVR